MRNKLEDLNNHLFAQIERLGDENLKPEEIDVEVKRAKAMSGIASNIINNARTVLDGMKFAYNELPGSDKKPEMFQLRENK